MVDIIIFYEHAERELNNAYLLKAEFERRGYTVDIKYFWSSEYFISPIKEKPKLIIAHSAYDDSDLPKFTVKFRPKIDKILNMRYEQVISKRILNSSLHYPSGKVKNMSFVCWSEHIKEEMLKQGIPEKNLVVTGDIKTDFSNELFDSFFKTKKELAEEFNLNAEKDWVLFISSFTFRENEPESRLIRFNNNLDDAKYFQKWNVDSKKILMEWIIKFLEKHPDKEFIYRPHPSEFDNCGDEIEMHILEKKYPNFHYIIKYSIQEWIRPCEFLNTISSTSIIDAYLLKKQCNILRPKNIDADFDNPLLINSEYISTYEDFERYNTSTFDSSFPIPKDIVDKYYYFGDKLAYFLICDYAEKMINDDSFKSDFYIRNHYLSRFLFLLNAVFENPKGILTIFGFLYSKVFGKSSEDKKSNYLINYEKINEIILNK